VVSLKKPPFSRFAANAWRIYSKEGPLVPYILNPAQRAIEAIAQKQRRAKRPIRIRVLKYRQAGISLYCSTRWGLWPCITQEGTGALSIADKNKLVGQWVRRLRFLLDQLPARPSMGAESAEELWFDKLGSRYAIATASGKTPGMGDTLRYVHCSELASWDDPEAVLHDLIPAVPAIPDSAIIQESTGRSVGDWWYQRYHEAKRGAEGYKSIFLPWFIQPEYRADPSGITDLTPYEQRLVKVGVDRSQLAWRRWMLIDEFHGDEDAFANQFPADEDEAFLAGGINVFPRDQVEKARETVRAPTWRGSILPKDNPAEFQLVGTDGGDLLIWEHPDERYHYVIGADCMWGEKDKADYDTAFVECLETRRVVAKLKGRFPLPLWGRLLSSLGYHYGSAVLAPERNAQAADALMPLLLGLVAHWRYPNVWVRTDDISLKGHRPQDYGWYTGPASKGELIQYAQTATLEGSFDWADETTVDQMASYIRDDQGKLTAPEGAFDDDLMARMITAYVAHVQRPRTDLYVEPVRPVYESRTLGERLRDDLDDADRAMVGGQGDAP